MRPNLVRRRIADGLPVVNGWLSIGSSYAAEGLGHAGYHSVTVDLQHGMLDFSVALGMLQALSATPAVPLARVPALDTACVMHLLDAGAYGIVCPMISTPEETAALVAACRYPPEGQRSYGPARGLLYGGSDYVARANAEIMAIPMIETAEAVERIDDILAVPGVDMVYLGPNDLAYAMDGRVVGPRPRSTDAIAHVLGRARAAGVPAGVFCADAAEARDRVAQGFALVTPGNDFGLLRRSATAAVRDVLAPASSQAAAGHA